MKRIILLMLALLTIVGTAFGIGFSPWVGMTGESKLAINPFFYIPISFNRIAFDLVGAYGITPNIDVLANLSSISLSSNGTSWLGAWIMPRYDFGSLSILPYNIIGIQLGYIGTFLGAIHYHTLVKPIDIFGIEINGIASYAGAISLSGTIAPFLNIFGPLSIYFEFDPSYTLDLNLFGYSLVSGIDINLSPYGELNIGYNIASSSIVGWYFITF